MKPEFLRALKEKVANFSFNAVFILWSAFYGVLCMPLLLVLPASKVVELRKPWISVILYFLKLIFNINFEIRGLEKLKKYKNFIIAAKHHSPLDVLLLAQILKKPAFVLKRELLKLPILGLYLLASKMIPVNQESKTNGIDVLRRMLKNAKMRLEEGRTIIIYPEGQRTEVGSKVKYKRGVLALYKKLKVPVFPVSLNAGLIWPIGYFSNKRAGKVVIEILDPILEDFHHHEFLNKLEYEIEVNTSALCSVDSQNLYN